MLIWYCTRFRKISESAGAEITVPAAEFAILVSITFKLLSAVCADDGVIGFLLNLLPVAVPPGHAALIRAESLFLSSRQCCDRSAAVLAGFATFQFRVAADMGSDCIHRKSQLPCDFRWGFPLEPHLVNDVDFLFCHSGNSPFEFAFSYIVLPTRCPLYRHRDPYRAWVYSPGNICEFEHGTQCPLSKGIVPWIHMALPPSFDSQCVATCSKFFRNISIRNVYKNISFFLATSCYRGYADRNSEALTR